MSSPEEISTGFYNIETLPVASSAAMVAYRTTDWAGNSELFVADAEVSKKYSHIFDWGSGYLHKSPDTHPLRQVENILQRPAYITEHNLRNLSFQVGQVCEPERKHAAATWEVELINELVKKVDGTKFSMKPSKSWGKADYTGFYEQIRAVQSAALRQKVVWLAGQLVLHNTERTHYTAKESSPRSSDGWVAPVVGLTINTLKQNDYYSEPHEVSPVVRQTDGMLAILESPVPALYAASRWEIESSDL